MVGSTVDAPPRPGNVYDRMPSLPFIWWACGLALTAGFGFGMLLFLHLASGAPSGLWWLAASQAHGHVQLFGWGGLFALGIGLHFLPRLRGCPSPSPRAVRIAGWLVGGGLALRGLTQPAVAAVTAEPWRTLAAGGLLVSGVAELAGVVVAVGALLAVARKGPALKHRGGLVAVLPFLGAFMLSMLIALVVNAVGVAGAAQGNGLVNPSWDWLVVQLGLVGMLVSICAAVSARTFPLYLQLRVPPQRELYGIAAVFFAGFLLRATVLLDVPVAPAIGSLLLGASFLALVYSLDVPLQRTKRTLPGQISLPLAEYRPASWLIHPAYAWLGVAGLLLVLSGLGGLGVGWSPPQDAERHALGVGLVTLLILGMAVRLLPGFTGRPLYSVQLVWATVWLGNAAVLLRVVPLFLPSSRFSTTLLGISGLLGLAAVACLAWNLWKTAHRPAPRPQGLSATASPVAPS